MIENRDILYFGSNDWKASVRTSTHQIARLLARKNRVLYIDSLGLRGPRLTVTDSRRILVKLMSFVKGYTIYVSPNLYGFVPISIPFHYLRIARRINRRILISSLNRITRQLHFKNPILWMFNPNLGDLIGCLGEELSLYYCIDDYASFPHVHRAAIRAMENDVLRKVDLAFVSAPGLLEERKRSNPNTYLSPHGVDLDHFVMRPNDKSILTQRYPEIIPPVIGYFGLISDPWIDVKLLEHIAKNRPHFSIVLFGEVRMGVEPLKKYSNIFILGPISYDDLPQLAAGFDVGIIPFQVNRVTEHSNPIKAKEYLAMGKPVISTPIPALMENNAFIYIGHSEEEFLLEIDRALRENNLAVQNDRRKFVADDSWEARLEKISNIIEETYDLKFKEKE